MKLAGRLALGLGAVNLASLIAMAAVSAADGLWAVGDRVLPADALPVSVIAQRLESRGLVRIYGVETVKGAYEVKAVDAAGRRVRLTIDPITGNLITGSSGAGPVVRG